MTEDTVDPAMSRFEERSRALFQNSVAGLDMGTRSRLTQARHAALRPPRPPLVSGPGFCAAGWASAAGVTCAACSAWRCGLEVR